MDVFYLTLAVLMGATASVFGGFYNRKNEGRKNVSVLYSILLLSAVFLFWVVRFLLDREATVGVLPYAFLFAFFYITCSMSTIVALKTGPIILTSLILQLSGVVVAVWGFFFWDAPITLLVGMGIVLVIVSLCLCLYDGKGEKEKAITPKWLFYVAVIFVGNSGCAIVQRTQQINFEGKYGNFLMVTAMGLAVVACAIIYFCTDKTAHKSVIKQAGGFPVLAGVCNGLLNLCMILLATSTLSTNLIYPTVSVGSLAITLLFSMLVFQEKMRWWQWMGMAVGAVAVVLLSI